MHPTTLHMKYCRVTNTTFLFSLVSSSIMRAESAILASGGAVSELVFSNSPFVLSVRPSHTLGRPAVLHGNSEMSAILPAHPGTSDVLYVTKWDLQQSTLLMAWLPAVLPANPGTSAVLSVTNGTFQQGPPAVFPAPSGASSCPPAHLGESAVLSVPNGTSS
jgi:hypothetical protein